MSEVTELATPRISTPAPGVPIETEVLVLGAGPGGYTAAFRAADLGKRVVLVERYADLGGVCLNVGCIPSKALLHLARVLAELEEFRAHGIELGGGAPDLEKVRVWMEKVVGRLTGGLRQMSQSRKIRVLQGVGQFVSANALEAATPEGKVTVRFEHAIIAAGSQAVKLPGLPADSRIWDSTDALLMRSVPERLLVVGGGIIGLEMATAYDAPGSRVTVVEMLEGLMTGCDRDLVRVLSKRIGKRYAAIHTRTKLVGVEAREKTLQVALEGPDGRSTAEFEAILVAIGRRPNGHRIGAENAGIHVDERGFIPIDDQMRTSVPHIFAIGDIAGEPLLAHKASHEGKVAAEVAAGLKSGFEGRVVPSVAYTDPEIAWVGITETEAKARGLQFGKGIFPWAASARSLTLGRDDGLTKLLFDPETHRIIGAGIVGTNAGDLIDEATLAIEMGADARDLGLTIHPHPTLSETVGMAAEVFEGTVTDLYVPRR